MKRILLTALALSSAASAEQITLSAQHQRDLSLTLYTQNLALIQEHRSLGPLKPNDQVVVRDVSQQMLPPSLQIFNAGNILEQSLKQATLNYQNLLFSYIGRELTLAKQSQSGDSEIKQQVKLLSVDDRTAMIEADGAIESIPLNSEHWRFIFPSRPQGMLLKPSLTFKSAGKTHSEDIALSYLSQGLSWQMDYVLQLNKTRDNVALKGLATLYNNTNTVFDNAAIRLLAGSLPQQQRLKRERMLMASAAMADQGAPNQQAQSLGDLYLYKLNANTSLYPQQQVQVPLFAAQSIPANVRYRHSFYVAADPGGNAFSVKPEATLYFKNTLNRALKQPLPAGQARVFTPDSDRQQQFIGASQIPHTAAGEEIALALGKAFDLKITQRRTDYQKTFNGALISLELKIENSSNSPKTLELLSNFSHSWELVSSTYPATQKNAGSGKWQFDIPGNNTTLFTLQARLKTK
ncbi:MAG: DUF4139 domain-containing protein [Pseudomonadales bacterium]